MATDVQYLIIGAGPTGLGAALALKEAGVGDFRVLERNGWPGGLSASFVDAAGFTWDIGGHVTFSNFPAFDALFDAVLERDGWLTHARDARALIEGAWVHYPVQRNIGALPRETMWRCVEGLVEAALLQGKVRPENFREWILASFGRGLADVFMFPYNAKVWGVPLEEMSLEWIGERVAEIDLREMVRAVLLGQEDATWGGNRTFRFPRRGGTGAIWSGAAAQVGRERIHYDTEVVEIDRGRRLARTAGG